MHDNALVEVEQLTRDYGRQRAVDGVSFRLRRGEVLGFLGPNGAGKSTTMQMLCGVLAPSAGAIRICGADLLDRPRDAKTHLGYLPEQPPLYGELTVDEYLRFCARLHGVAAGAVADAVGRAKSRCGLQAVGRRLLANLSKGFQQRVGIAQAIVHTPDLVVLDEPTVGLDPIQIREIRELIAELGDEHGVILSTHILPEVQAVCSRVILIHQGRLVLDESLNKLDQGGPAGRLRLTLRSPPRAEVLAAVPGVLGVEPLEDGRFRLHHGPDSSPAEDLARRAVEQGWGLQELAPESRSLEDLFVQLTCGDGPADEERGS